MLLIHRSILKELTFTLLLSLLFLNFSLMMEKLLRLSRILAGVGASVADLAEMIILLQPQLSILTIPMSLLLSVLLTYGRMNADNEIAILKVSGMSFRAVSQPVLYLGIACLLISLSMSFYVGPKSSIVLRGAITKILTTRAPLAIEEGIFNTSFKDIMLLVREKPAPSKLSGIFIVDERSKTEQKVIVAREGNILPGNESLGLSLHDGHVYITKGSTVTEIRFGSYRFDLSPAAQPADKKMVEYTPFELLDRARETTGKTTPYYLEFSRRLSMPAVCLIVILLGPPLSLLSGKSGRLGGLTLGLLVFVAYYSILIYGENLARSGTIPHPLGSWLAFVMLSLFSLGVAHAAQRR
ncbi:MAG: LptF/LptG family permease [Chloroflexota bacterium]